MPLLKLKTILTVVLVSCLSPFALAASHDHHAGATPSPAEPSRQAIPQNSVGPQLAPELLSLLNHEMRLIQKGMMDLVPAIAAGEWDAVSAIGQKIKASFILKQTLTGQQKEELHRLLPQQFIEMDRDFHQAAGMLAHAAEMKNADVVNFYFYKMNAACVSCHGKYAAGRFPGLARQGYEDHH